MDNLPIARIPEQRATYPLAYRTPVRAKVRSSGTLSMLVQACPQTLDALLSGDRDEDIRQVWFVFIITVLVIPLVIGDAAAVGHLGPRHAHGGDWHGEAGVSSGQRGHRR